jgi:hypothetical protein
MENCDVSLISNFVDVRVSSSASIQCGHDGGSFALVLHVGYDWFHRVAVDIFWFYIKAFKYDLIYCSLRLNNPPTKFRNRGNNFRHYVYT